MGQHAKRSGDAMKGRIIHVTGNPVYLHPHETDVTDAVQVLYDLVINSQNFGSGFWTIEDLQPVAALAKLCEFDRSGEVQEYIDRERHYQEVMAWQREQTPSAISALTVVSGMSLSSLIASEPTEHEHVYSSVGRCMWPRCNHRKEE